LALLFFLPLLAFTVFLLLDDLFKPFLTFWVF
jgi:hypothetical protein